MLKYISYIAKGVIAIKRKLINKKKYPPACKYCCHGRLSPNEKTVLCIKKGITEPDYKCRKFGYDPLKRRPQLPPQPISADKKEFEL